MGRLAARQSRYDARRLGRLAIDSPMLRRYHRRFRLGLWRYVATGDISTMLSAPLIYSMAAPFALLDLWVTVYQAVCFRAWGIRRVRRRDYFAIDRHRLAYLNGLEKFNCLFCSYANGLIGYVREIAARTEQYWCPIRHRRRTRQPHRHYHAFLDYGDARGYRGGLASIRAALKK